MRTFREFLIERQQEEGILDPVKDMFTQWDGSYDVKPPKNKKSAPATPLNDILGRTDGSFERDEMKKGMKKKMRKR